MSPVKLAAWMRSSAVRTFCLTFLVCAAWSIATPPFASPDEPGHVLRAAAVAHGQFGPAEGADRKTGTVQAPESIWSATEGIVCFAFHADESAACVDQSRISSDESLVDASAYSMARYNPVYYALVGWPALISGNWHVIYAMRLVSAALCSGLLTVGLTYFRRTVTSSLARSAAVVALTPMCFFFFGVVNANSLEISSAFAVWAIVLYVLKADPVRRRDVVALVSVSALLLVARQISPLWLAVIFAFAIAQGGRHPVRVLFAHRIAWLGLSLLLVLAAGSALWTVRSDALTLYGQGVPGTSYREGLRLGFFLTPDRLEQMIGYFGWLDTPLPAFTLVVWVMLIGVVVLVPLMTAQRRDAVVALGLIAVTLLIPPLLEARGYSSVGPVWQGRYTLPIAVGIPLVLAPALERGRGADSLVRFGTTSWSTRVAVVASLAHLAAFYWTLRRYVNGADMLDSLNVFRGAWQPPLGSAALLLLLGLSSLLLYRDLSRSSIGRYAGPGNLGRGVEQPTQELTATPVPNRLVTDGARRV